MTRAKHQDDLEPLNPSAKAECRIKHCENCFKLLCLLMIFALVALNISLLRTTNLSTMFNLNALNSSENVEIPSAPSSNAELQHIAKVLDGIEPFWQFEPDDRLYDQRTDIPTKTVLLWTDFFGNWSDHYGHNMGSYTELEIYNRSKRCFYTRDRSLLNKSSGLMFHGRDFNFNDLPKNRFPWQRWVFYLHESPVHSGFDDRMWDQANHLEFNWTMTYAKASNVYHPYGHVRRSKKPFNQDLFNKKVLNFTTSFRNRSKDAVWIVSNCYAPSGRRQFVDKMIELGITVDIFGNCGTRDVEKIWATQGGETAFFAKYRFMFSFENSLCEDYITEKAFHAFYANFIAGSIPIVYSGGNYSDFFPDGSYINMRDFDNVMKMVELMKSLSTDPKKLRPYYDWQKTMNPAYETKYELAMDGSDRYELYYTKRGGWRNLCKALWDNDSGTGEKTNFLTSHVPDIRKQIGKCIEPNLRPVGANPGPVFPGKRSANKELPIPWYYAKRAASFRSTN